MGQFQRSCAKPKCLSGRKRQAPILSKLDQQRLATMKAADVALRQEMQRLNVRFD